MIEELFGTLGPNSIGGERWVVEMTRQYVDDVSIKQGDSIDS